MTARVFFYVQHLLGIGHIRRAAVLTSPQGGTVRDTAPHNETAAGSRPTINRRLCLTSQPVRRARGHRTIQSEWKGPMMHTSVPGGRPGAKATRAAHPLIERAFDGVGS